MGEATLPGEVSGPALQVHVTVEAGGEPLDLTGAAVTLHYGDQDASAGLLSEGTQTLPEEVSAGGTATGDYVFSVPEDARDRVVVRVYVSTDLPVTVFQGAAS
ncbi:hypothetical protein [Actinomyces succiniciruminis]|uniref:Uncharacterized protein n=1 Tax=Actinomyces succiniciruminis TaxID=1522002 RepID=A0A1L7RSQ2_9ACTO|nr:hypothetical protein [Actinomyces succiniciruminis]CED92658.1 Hypothetical protein AAM4_2826 [Actinomyces succiniciruminis]